jgi:hypothetical protein
MRPVADTATTRFFLALVEALVPRVAVLYVAVAVQGWRRGLDKAH